MKDLQMWMMVVDSKLYYINSNNTRQHTDPSDGSLSYLDSIKRFKTLLFTFSDTVRVARY